MKHAHPAELIAFFEKMTRELEDPRAYLRRSAEWVKANYPESEPLLLPVLRKLYKSAKRKG